MKKAKEIIAQFRPCTDSIEWLGERTIQEMVNECYRGDWLLWIGKRAGVDLQKLTLAKGLIAQQVEHLMKDQRSKDAVTAAISFGRGEISRAELDTANAAAYAAYDANVAYAAAYAAANAAYAAAAAAAYAAANDANVAYAAAYTAANAAYDVNDVNDVNYDDVRTNNLKKSSDICREIFGKELIKLLNT